MLFCLTVRKLLAHFLNPAENLGNDPFLVVSVCYAFHEIPVRFELLDNCGLAERTGVLAFDVEVGDSVGAVSEGVLLMRQRRSFCRRRMSAR